MEIPYTVRPRPDTGLANPKLGIWLFLASEVMLFGGLFAGYIFMRLSAEPWYWPVGWLNVPVGTFNTFILIFSSVTIILAWECLKMKKFKAYQTWLAVTWICGLAFLGVKLGIEWPDKFHHFGAYVKKEALPKYEAFLGNEDSKAADGSVLEGRRSRLTHDGKPMAERRFISGHVHDTEGAKQTALYLSGIPYVSPVQLSNIIGSVKSKKELLDELPKKISAAEAKSAADFGGGPDGERKRIAAIEALRLEKRIAENSLASISKLMETKYGMTPEEQAIILDPKKSDDERKKASDA